MSSDYLVKNSILTMKFSFKYKLEQMFILDINIYAILQKLLQLILQQILFQQENKSSFRV